MTPLRNIRNKRCLPLSAVAEAVGTDAGNLSRIETGKQKPTPQLAEALSLFFGGAVTELEIIYPERYSKAILDDQPT